MKITAKVNRDEGGRPTRIEISTGLILNINYDATNRIYSVEFSGRKTPSITDILAFMSGQQQIVESIVEIEKAQTLAEYAAINNLDLIEQDGSQALAQWVQAAAISYAVPPNRTLLIYDYGVYVGQQDVGVIGFLWNAVTSEVLCRAAAISGFFHAFTKPKRVGSGETVEVRVSHNFAGVETIIAHFSGILI